MKVLRGFSPMRICLLELAIVLVGVADSDAVRLDSNVPMGHLEIVERFVDVKAGAPKQLPIGHRVDGVCLAGQLEPQVVPRNGVHGRATCVEDWQEQEASCPDGQLLTGLSMTGEAQCQEDTDIRVSGRCLENHMDITILADGTVLCTTGLPHQR